MKILYDDQTFSMQKFGGISRAFTEILSQENKYVEKKLSCIITDDYYINRLEKKYYSFKRNFKGRNRITKIINRVNSIYSLIFSKYDVFHPTYYDPYFLKYTKSPYIVTVHDMIHELYDLNDDKLISDKFKVVKNADKIVAISENTKKDIINIYGIDASKIEVVYWANSLDKTKVIDIPNRYILFVGARGAYKNFDNFINACTPLLLEDETLNVICTGGGPFSDKEIKLLEDLNIIDKIIRMDVDDEELAFLYKNALSFVFPSKYEGFGIPILEAFHLECPTILSNASCFPEIAADAARYFDPNDINNMTETIKEVIYNESTRKMLINKGLERNKLFTWDKTIQKYNEIYRSLL